jgi:hypothetical protein
VDGTLKSSVTTANLNLTKGSLFGTGTLGFSVVNSSVLTPGDSSSSTALLAVSGGYKQSSTGTLDISIAGTTPGTKYDQLKVTGAASLGGTLNLTLLNGYVPALNATFDILTGSSVSGTFSTVNGAINGSEHFSVSCAASADECVATVVSGAAATKQTATASLAPSVPGSKLAAPALLSSANVPQNAPTAVSAPVFSRMPTFRARDAQMSPYQPAALAAGNDTGTRPVPALSRLPTFQPRDSQMPPYKTSAMASSPLSRAMGQKYNGVDFGVDLNLLLKTSPRAMMKGFTGSAYVPPVGYILTTH